MNPPAQSVVPPAVSGAEPAPSGEPAPPPAPPPAEPDWRDRHIRALEEQCAALRQEIAAARARVDPEVLLVAPARGGGPVAVLEVFWKAAGQAFCAANGNGATVPQGGFVSRRYFALPQDAAGQLRIDPGDHPGLWLLSEITLHDVDDQGALMQPPVGIWDHYNDFAGLKALQGAMILPGSRAITGGICRVLCWDNDPQLLLALRANPEGRPRILEIRCASLDLAHAIMAQHGQLLSGQIAHLQAMLADKAKG